ncbi:hypothetical protein AA15669_1354 [Saccharibacter floricola DSM 15669]|uniref:Transposase n=1 Tax=Saccharibacter floricola DSM 15669 TaxID=1123227 RepID=A0ABQ0P0B9_9PROT|nr:hypothetical protein AA15669_1354 [Saccharibacter floricola DSM 15669]
MKNKTTPRLNRPPYAQTKKTLRWIRCYLQLFEETFHARLVKTFVHNHAHRTFFCGMSAKINHRLCKLSFGQYRARYEQLARQIFT